MNGRTAAIAGGSGLVGSACLTAAVEHYEHVVALVRRRLQIEQPHLEYRIVDYEHLPDKVECDDAFCALGTTIKVAGSREQFRRVDVEYPLRFAAACKAGGARQFLLVSSVGASARSSNFYLRTKAEAETEVARPGFEALHIFRPSLLLGRRKESRPGERIGGALVPLVQFLLAGDLRKYRAISADAVGRAMVAAAMQGGAGIHIHHYDELIALAASVQK